ncbi:MAG TPA: hypothetical protein VI934_00305, partial [Candidatus Nanoarchaeia archaeon]|nr:hypothetical protein [Candidatus Nanoarchaeia archaeon]
AFQDSPSPETFSKGASPYNRWQERSSFNLTWTWPKQIPAATITSPDLSQGIQELVNKHGNTNSVVLLEANTTSIPPGQYHEWYSYDNNPAFAAKLHIEYTVPLLSQPEASPPNNESNETEIGNKTIRISLSYASGTPFDQDNDGVETTEGAVDFSIANTSFSWPVNQSYLCALWNTFSMENQTSSLVCHGSESCCALLELAPSVLAWNENFATFFGRYGATYHNSISAQVVYANYSLGPESVFSEILYSNWTSLNATFE